MTVGRKQGTTQADWINALATIEQSVTRDEMDALLEKTAASVRKVVAGKHVAFGWSGGKDSVALELVMRCAGIEQCVLVICELEFPEFLRWATDNMPPELEIVNTGQGLDWLASHPDMLFPQSSKTAAKWFKVVQHSGQEQYYSKHGLDMLITGRRKADGNHVGPGGLYSNARGVTRYSPICDWTHEQLLAAIHYYGLPLAPCYAWPQGFRQGTGPWAARQWCSGVDGGWREVFAIDPSVVRAAASRIPSAAAFLQRVGA
jgi:3'-phosphoadenosine 5'-phosphosulfate sulfotransferase (PAPS reductase)/FAD synthetase